MILNGDKIEAQKPALRIAAILTCFNRKQKTLDCLDALAASTGIGDVLLEAVLVDDGSTDGTADAVRARFSWVKVVSVNENLFWCRGMHKAFDIAMQGDYDYYLWLNDDTTLYPDALFRLLECESALRAQHGKPAIVVGSTVDAKGMPTYGGAVQESAWKRTKFRRLLPAETPQRCDAMNGNIVLVPREVAQVVGNLDPAFEHAMGDTDYALRARRLGIGVWVGPGVHGVCESNSSAGTFMDSSLPLRLRWKLMMSRKGLPWRSWLVLTRRHTGLLWPLYFSWPYFRLVLNLDRRHSGCRSS